MYCRLSRRIKTMSVFKRDDLEKRVEVLEKKVKELYKIIGKPIQTEVENKDDEEYCIIS